MEIKRDFIFDPSLVLYLPLYELDGASFMSKDSHGHLCTVTGAVWRPNGRYFDGVDDYIQISNPPVTTNQQGTISVWLNKDATSRQCFMCYGKPDTASIDAMRFYIDANDDVYYDVYQSGVNTMCLDSADNVITSGRWHLVTFTSDGSTIKAYVDGVEKALTASVGTNTGLWFADVQVEPADTIVFGGYYRLGALVEDYAGYIGEIRVYRRALTPQEVEHNYLATKWRYR